MSPASQSPTHPWNPSTVPMQKCVQLHCGHQEKTPLWSLKGTHLLSLSHVISTQPICHWTSVSPPLPAGTWPAGYWPKQWPFWNPWRFPPVPSPSSCCSNSVAAPSRLAPDPYFGTNLSPNIPEIILVDMVEEEEGARPPAQAASSSPDEVVAGHSNLLSQDNFRTLRTL